MNMKLYELHRGDRFRILSQFVGDEVYEFDHIDGAYSVCYLEGEVVHLAAWTEVERVL